MPRKHIRTYCLRPGDVWGFLLAGSMAVLVAMPGCTGGDIDAVRELDSTLARVERLLDDGKVLEARTEMIVNLGGPSSV